MSKKPKALKRAEEYSVGDTFEERWMNDEVISVGKIMAMSSFKNRMYFLIRDDKRQYTIYVAQTKCICKPIVARCIPENVVRYLYAEAFMDDDNPPHKREPVKEAKQSLQESAEIAKLDKLKALRRR